MAYRNFTFQKLEQQFQIRQTTGKVFREPVAHVAPSSLLLAQIELAGKGALTTEKALSEAIAFPILQEIKIRNETSIELFSGEVLTADIAAGLNGETDFLYALAPGSKYLKSLIISVTEAKKGEINNPKNLSQTCAQMLGASIFNENHDTPHETIFGACTSATDWLFMKLEGRQLTIDSRQYATSNLPELLGALQQMVDLQKA